MREVNDYLSKSDEELAKSINYRVYGIEGPLPESIKGDTPKPVPPSNLNITCSENTVTISAENANTVEYRFNEEENWTIYTEPFNITQTVTVYAKATNNSGTTTASSVCEYTILNDRIILYFSKGANGTLFGSLSGVFPYDGSMFDYMIVDGIEYHENFWSDQIHFDNPDINHEVQLVLKSNQPQPLPASIFFQTGASSVIIPSSITSIGEYAFQRSSCYSFILPDTITSLGVCSFGENNHLTEITIPSSVTSIGDEAFLTAEYINKYTFLPTTPPILGAGAIGIIASPVIYVPASSVEAYKSAESWKLYTDYIQPIQ